MTNHVDDFTSRFTTQSTDTPNSVYVVWHVVREIIVYNLRNLQQVII